MNKIIPTKNQLIIMKEYWKRCKSLEDYYYRSMGDLEREMSNVTKIEDLEFFFCDGDCAGIGNVMRTMKLIHREELE